MPPRPTLPNLRPDRFRDPAAMPTAFNLTKLPNRRLHLDATTLTGVADGGVVGASAWADISGSATPVTVVNGPTYIASGQNGLPVVRFVRTATQYVACNSLAPLVNGQDIPWTLIMVARRATVAVVAETLFAFASTVDSNDYHHLRYRGLDMLQVERRTTLTSALTVNAGVPGTAMQVLSHVFHGTTASLWVSGTAATLAAPLDAEGFATATATLAARQIGGVVDSPASMDIAEAIVCLGALPTTDRQNAESVLAQKWAIV